jgi:hypothetical protein
MDTTTVTHSKHPSSATNDQDALSFTLSNISVKSSKGLTFWVISNRSFVNTSTPLDLDTMQQVMKQVHELYLAPKAIWGQTQLLIDFEGEMLGFGGVMTSAAVRFLNDTKTPGLFIDMETKLGIQLMREIMESSHLQKLIWGAESDCASLLHQQRPIELGIRPVNVVDVQLMYSTHETKRLSMKKALTTIVETYPEALTKLPPKDCIEWNEPYSRNQRVLAIPLSSQHVTYAVDDLCRLELVLQHQMDLVPIHEFQYAQQHTEQLIQVWSKDYLGTRWFWRQWRAYKHAVRKKFSIVDQNRRAVVIVRHLMEVHRRCNGEWKKTMSPSDARAMLEAFQHLPTHLARFGVIVSDDLSFSEG